MAMNVTALRHTGCDDLGHLASLLDKLGAKTNYVDAYHVDLADFDALAPELLIVLGGSPGVYQRDLYPFIDREVEIIKRRIDKNLPTLGICLGAQMMANALGSSVYIGGAGPEIGWFDVAVNDEGMKTPARHLDLSCTKLLQAHGDTFDLPAGVTLLASSDKYKNQMFSIGKNFFAMQCHAEVSAPIIEGWLVSYAGKAEEINIRKIREDTKAHLDIMQKQTEKFFFEWIEGLEWN